MSRRYPIQDPHLTYVALVEKYAKLKKATVSTVAAICDTSALDAQILALQAQIVILDAQILLLQNDLAACVANEVVLQAQIVQLQAQITALNAQIVQLQAQLAASSLMPKLMTYANISVIGTGGIYIPPSFNDVTVTVLLFQAAPIKQHTNISVLPTMGYP